MRNSLGQRKFLSLLFVSSVEMSLIVIMILADTVIAGQAASEAGVSAVNVITPIAAVITCVGSVICMGVSFIYGNAMGRSDQKRADELFGMSIILAVESGLAMFALVSVFKDEYFAFMNPAPEILSLAREYYSYLKFVILINPLALVLSSMVYNDGDELISNLANITNVFGNIVLSLIFAFPLKMGIAGVALGTLCKDIISIAVLSCHFLRKSNSLHARIYFSFRELWNFIRLGFVDSGVYLMWAVLIFIMNKFIISRFGSEYLPVLSMAVSVLEFSIMFDGAAQTVIPLVSVYYSEGNYPAVKKVMNLALWISIIEGVVITLIIFVFAEHIPGMFDIDDPKILGDCVRAVRILCLMLTVSAVLYLYETYYIILDKSVIAMISSCLRSLILIILLAVPPLIVRSLDGIWLAFASAQIFALMICNVIICMIDGRKLFPLYLEEKYPIADFDLLLTPENIISTRDSAAKFMKSHGQTSENINRVMLLIEEVSMLILERNEGRRKKVLAEYTIELHEDGEVRLSIRDDGEIFDVTDDDMKIISLRSYVVSRLMRILSFKRNIITTSFNKNMFNVRGGIARKLIMR